MKERVVFSDIDGTLGFYAKEREIEQVHPEDEQNRVLVADREADTVHLAYSVTSSRYTIFFAERALDLCRQVQQTHDFIYVTGARLSSLESRRHLLDFANRIIIENGGVILDSNYERDSQWESVLAHDASYLKDFSKRLIDWGWHLDIEGRAASLRVRKKENPNKGYDEFTALRESVELPEELQKTSNTGHLDILPRSAGKFNAIRYLMETRGYAHEGTKGVGDDLNDKKFLDWVSEAFVLASSHREILQLAQEKKWFISQGKYFNGIEEILEEILRRS